MAIQLHRQKPPRPRAFQALAAPIDNLLTPLAHGPVGDACYAICPAPPGASVLSRSRPWPEAELLECVLRPAAHMLEHLQARGMTHRGIRPDNVFQSAPGQPVVFGPCWAAPPAMAQPALFEPPYSAMCLPAGRGDGSIADDVYALGVLLLCLALGRAPLAQLDDAAILRRKLELGTYAALAGDQRLPPIIGDLVRGMLAEDPEHRPTADLAARPGERAWTPGRGTAAAASAAAHRHRGQRGLGCTVAGLRPGARARPRAERGARQRRRAMAAPRVGRRATRRAGGRAGAPSRPGPGAGRRRWRGRAGDARDRGARSAGATVLARGGVVAGRNRHRAGRGPG